MLPEPGTYPARTDKGVIYETDGGALMAAFDCRIDEQTSIVARMCMFSKSGDAQQGTIRSLREAFGWDGTDPFWFQDTDLSQMDIEIVVEMETGQDGVERPRVRWINRPGGGHGMPEPGDRRAILAKYGARFRALAGGSAVKPQSSPTTSAPRQAPPTAPKTAPPVASGGPARHVKPASLQEAWDAVCQSPAASMVPEDKLTAAWFDILARLVKKDQAECSPEDWGLVVIEGPALLDEILERI